MNPRAFVVMNPAAGRGANDAVRQDIEAALNQAGWAYDLHETSDGEDLASVVRERVPEAPDVVIACGGDGTVCWAAGGLVNTEIPLGLVPSGTGNSLARSLGVPIDPKRAMTLITGPHALRLIDALKAEERYFLLNASVGLTAEVMQDASREEKNRLGCLAYIITFLRTMIGLQRVSFKLTVDDKVHNVRASDAVIANSGAIGLSSFRLAPDISLDDGEVAVCIIRARSIVDYFIAALNIIFDVPERSKRLRCMTARTHVTIEPGRVVPKQGDGEPLGYGSLSVDVIHSAVRIVTPEDNVESR